MMISSHQSRLQSTRPARHQRLTRQRFIGLRPSAASEPPIEPSKKAESPQDAVEKYGLEAGLFKVLTSSDDASSSGEGKPTISRTDQAKQLLTQYGGAYLVTSIGFAAISFAICYAAVNSGVDMSSLLAKIGLQVNETNETVGTFAIAYAAHKALSPIRFPPTVALTPVVARWFGKKE